MSSLNQKINQQIDFVLTLFLYVIIFFFDSRTQHGIIGWGAYFIPFLLNFSFHRSQIFILSALGTMLIVSGLWLSSPGIPFLSAIFNRALGIILFWLSTYSFNLRKKAEVSLQNERNLLQAIYDMIPIMFVIFDPKSGRIRINNHFQNVTGWIEKDVNESNFMARIVPNDGDQQMVYEFIKSSYSGYRDWVIRTKDLKKIDTSWAKVTLPDGRQLGFGIDIRERKEAENILRRDKDTLERLVNERSQELLIAEQKLAHARRLSDIGQLASRVAHELRNPLAIIKVAIFNIQHDLSKDIQKNRLERHLKKIGQKIYESEQIISNLLFYSRLKVTKTEKVNLLALIDESIETAKARHSDFNIDIKVRFPKSEKLEIMGDILQLKELFTNIINNAFDCLDNKKGVIEVFAMEEQNTIQIEVCDSGTGISSENLKKIFDPFFTTKSKGTGLGLSVSRQIVELHNGTINVDSKVGIGTKVIIIFPKT